MRVFCFTQTAETGTLRSVAVLECWSFSDDDEDIFSFPSCYIRLHRNMIRKQHIHLKMMRQRIQKLRN